jgi:hypothetical protein
MLKGDLNGLSGKDSLISEEMFGSVDRINGV